jgi:hypothetical protein
LSPLLNQNADLHECKLDLRRRTLDFQTGISLTPTTTSDSKWRRHRRLQSNAART